MEHIKTPQEDSEDFYDDRISDETQDKIDIIFLKNQLIASKEIDLKQLCSDPENYGIFIDVLNIALDQEPAFFFLTDEFLEAAEDVLHSKRFDYRPIDNYNEVINDIIGRINHLRTVPQDVKDRQARAYADWNLTVRQIGSNISLTDFYKILGHDAILIQELLKGNIDELDPFYFFASTNYLLTVMPELYETHPEIIDLTMEKLDRSINKRWFWNKGERTYAKEIRKNLQKVKVKEE